MAVTAQKSVASLMQKTLDRQAALVRMRLKFTKNQIEQILLNHARTGNVGPYGELVKVLREYPLSDENFRVLFEECLSCVMVLERDFKQFVEAACDVEWASRSEELVGLYSHFVQDLVTAHTYHCPQVITCLVKLFKADIEPWEDHPPAEILNKWSNIHTVIANILALIPMCSDLLIDIVIDQFPYYKAGCNINRAYVHNLIWMSKYLPSLREQLMTAIINRMITMDVNIVESEKNRSQSETVFEMDVEEKDEVSESLDYCMLEMLRWLEEDRGPVLNMLCNVFERVILPTYGIRHVQFLVLYTISINQQCADRILSNLWVVAAGLQGLGPGAFATRRTAASHLTGLLARCVRIPNTRLIHYLKTMAEWCHAYITATQQSTTNTDNLKAHGAFHAICHAIFYLVAFKNHHLCMNKENLTFVESLNLSRLVACSLNPLRSCAPSVARAFSSVTRAHQLVYCRPILERNARNSLNAISVHYDEWFPYDPYNLPRSGKIIWPLCREYKDFPKLGEDETQYTSMKKKLDGDDDDFLMSASPCQRLACSLSISVSPGFRTSENILID